MPERPARMYRQGRPLVPCDNPQEPLYRRFSTEEVIRYGPKAEFPGACFQFPDCSVNRGGSNFGEPEDVIFDFPAWGILKLLAEDVPPLILGGDSAEIPLAIEHCPEEKPGQENYAHCEIRIYRKGEAGQLIHVRKDLSKGAKKVWRQLMSRKVNARPDGIYKHAESS